MGPDPALVAARTALDEGNAEDALALVDVWLADHPDDAPALALRAESLLSLERWNEGLAATDALLERDPSEWTHRLRCVAFENLGRYGDAIESAQFALELAPYEANAYYLLAKGLWQSSRDDEAVVAFERAIALEPDVPLYRFGLASLVFDADPAKAEALLRRIVRDEPEHARALNDLGVLVEKRDPSAASALYASALIAEPGLPVARDNAERLARNRARRTRGVVAARLLAAFCAATLPAVVVLGRTGHAAMASAAAVVASLSFAVLIASVLLARARRRARPGDPIPRGVASWQGRDP